MLISSREIIEKTGISRATLNNYIKLGILPRPLIKKPSSNNIKTTKIGYFPESVIEKIELVMQMKKKGVQMEDIVRGITGAAGTISEKQYTAENSDTCPSGSNRRRLVECKISGDASGGDAFMKESGDNELHFTMSDIPCPAYLLNNKFEIEWINKEAEVKIFSRDIKSIRKAEERNIFKLLLGSFCPIPKHNIEGLLKFHIGFIKNKIPKDMLAYLYEGIPEKHVRHLENLYDEDGSYIPSQSSINEAYLNLNNINGSVIPYHVYQIVFREGILFVYAQADSLMKGIVEILSNRGKLINEVLKQRMPALSSFCVLVADLQDSSRICAELPPEEYFELINDMWKTMEGTFKKYYGTYGKHCGDGMLYYFLKDTNSEYLINSIYCALELREQIKTLSIKWKQKKGWANDLYLNIAINEGQEFFGTIPSAPSIEFTALGDSVNQAGRLSYFARYGAIWTTKNLLNKLPEEHCRTLRFGIRRKEHDREIFVENVYSRVIDMLKQDNPLYAKFMDIATLSITEIIGRKTGSFSS